MSLIWVLIVLERAKSSILPNGNFREFFLWRGEFCVFKTGISGGPVSKQTNMAESKTNNLSSSYCPTLKIWCSSTYEALRLRTVQEFGASWKMGRATKYCNSAVPCPIMSQTTYGCHLGWPILSAILPSNIHTNNRHAKLYRRAA